MNSIQKEFLYNENKLIPISLLKTNYGVASNISSINSTQVESIPIDIDFPSDSSSIVMLIDKETSPPKIVEVRACPPGSSSATLNLKDGTKYWIYVISKEYNDGYIGGDYVVGSDVTTGDRFEFSYDSAPQQVDLTISGRLIKSYDESDITQWYNYQGYYNGPLVWYYPSTVNGNPIGNSNFWMIVRQEILSQIENIFKQNDLSSFSVSNKKDVVKMHRILDDIAEFMRDRKLEYDTLLGDSANMIADIWQFLNAKLPGYGSRENSNDTYYLTYDERVSDFIDELGVYADFVNMTRLDSSSYPFADQAGQYAAATNQGLSSPLTYVDDDGVTRTYNLLGLTDETRFKGLYENGKDARASIAAIWEGIEWSRSQAGGSAGILDSDFRPAWNKFRSLKTEHIKEINNKLFNDYSYPIYVLNGDAQTLNNNWWESISTIALSEWDNIKLWLDDSLRENMSNIGLVGDSVFVSGSTGTTSQVEDQYTAQLALMQNIRFLKNQLTNMDENIWTTMNNTSALMLASLLDINSKIDQNKETNTIVNITSAKPQIGNIEVLYKKISGSATDWVDISSSIIDLGNDSVMLNLNTSVFSEIGKYAIVVRPRRLNVNVYAFDGEYLTIRDELNTYQTPNYFYGWNAQLYTPQNDIFGSQKIIVESNWKSSNQYLKVSPIYFGITEFDANSKLELWSNEFIPMMIDLSIVEHNALTLSYSLYGKRELNTASGLCTIYDHNGNVYKQLSFGKYSNNQTGNAIIEYRTPEDNPQY